LKILYYIEKIKKKNRKIEIKFFIEEIDEWNEKLVMEKIEI